MESEQGLLRQEPGKKPWRAPRVRAVRIDEVTASLGTMDWLMGS